jgi:hypothetical protein
MEGVRNVQSTNGLHRSCRPVKWPNRTATRNDWPCLLQRHEQQFEQRQWLASQHNEGGHWVVCLLGRRLR